MAVNAFRLLKSDVLYILSEDPAASNVVQVLLTYPGLHALIMHRINHYLYVKGLRTLPSLFSYFTRFVTGIEIHPGADIGGKVFIDHGHGVVIGETAVVKEKVTIYQGVTLGSTGKTVEGKRHPTIRQGVMLGAGCKVLGDIVVEEGVDVGAQAVVLDSVFSECTVVGVPAQKLQKSQGMENVKTCQVKNNTYEPRSRS